MVNEGPQKMDPNPYHEKYKQQMEQGGIPAWEEPHL
jgi:hypothetical protein